MAVGGYGGLACPARQVGRSGQRLIDFAQSDLTLRVNQPGHSGVFMPYRTSAVTHLCDRVPTPRPVGGRLRSDPRSVGLWQRYLQNNSPSKGSTTGTTTGAAPGRTKTTAGAQDCTSLNNSSYAGASQNQGVALSPNSGSHTKMPHVLFVYNTTATDPNKTDLVRLVDCDYCSFSADNGYTNWPSNGFHAASLFLIDAANSNGAFAMGNYTVAAGSQFIYLSSTDGDSARVHQDQRWRWRPHVRRSRRQIANRRQRDHLSRVGIEREKHIG